MPTFPIKLVPAAKTMPVSNALRRSRTVFVVGDACTSPRVETNVPSLARVTASDAAAVLVPRDAGRRAISEVRRWAIR